jgi:hypothetical protein
MKIQNDSMGVGLRWPGAEIATSSFPEVKRREGLLAMTEGVIFYY